MNKKKLMSLILALVMILGAFAPLTALAETTVTGTNLTIHKLKLDDFEGVTAKDHDGKELTQEKLNEYFNGKNPTGLPGVKFTYYKVNTAQLAKIDEAKPQTPAQVKAVIDANTTLFNGVQGVETEATDKDGKVTLNNLADGTYYFVESEVPANHTGALAVPFKITLPIYDKDGKKMDNVHIYPKNKLTDKTTSKELDETANTANKTSESHNVTITDSTGKKVLTLDKGAKVPYIVKTPIPAGSKEVMLAWSDRMSEGLTYNKDLAVSATYGDQKTDLGLVAADYTIENSDNGFVLKLTDNGIKKVLEKTLNNGDGVKLIDGTTVYNKVAKEAAQKVEFTLKYSATLNGLTGPVDPETNTVSFHYGNKPGYTPQPGDKNPIPEKGKTEINVNKSFVSGDGTGTETWPADMTITLKLEKWDQATNTWSEVSGKTLTLNSTTTSGKFDKLNKDEKYRVVEQEVKGWVPNYSHDTQGNLVIKNKKNPNPNPITPPEVTVTSGGIRFVKTDDNTSEFKRLVGGKFLIKNEAGKYLYYKSDADKKTDLEALATAEKNLQDKVDAYNKLTPEQQKDAENQTVKDINELAGKVKEAKQKANIQYEWKDGYGTVDNLAANLVVLVPNTDGYMEITGLDFATYKLHEIVAPQGYSLPSGGREYPFTVNANSYNNLNLTGENEMIDSSKTDTTKAQRIENKLVTIPQTGGIGTVIFTVVGISLMAGAFIAMRKRTAEEN
ncbi:LPXTG-motif cell wall anchor domain protein [Peptoniphilus duerdenii ATCC BAA-1640]|uniref:LPXTG-motif cell wall anchor domain protein n=1 Tax=Peptoniphilus duerdenii ATCC BAA-1640 TaxID=862517 RepID=E0NIX3_9FIRM|nr:pilin N-terminal domain-containing protein [Peptoniphilus duerdenii]EFM26263.1 LPXTG-motif cell wall anchor domain protein [Peptoniphilus duerdenii ATCC BAA-1640]